MKWLDIGWNFSLDHLVKNTSICTHSPVINQQEREDHLPPFIAEIKHASRFTSAPLHYVHG
jgi:hypothetical protein